LKIKQGNMTSWMSENMIQSYKFHIIILESMLLVFKFEKTSTYFEKQNFVKNIQKQIP
jgi:hypothetical protein